MVWCGYGRAHSTGTAAILFFCSRPLPVTIGLSPNLLPPQTPSLTIWVKLPIQYFTWHSQALQKFRLINSIPLRLKTYYYEHDDAFS